MPPTTRIPRRFVSITVAVAAAVALIIGAPSAALAHESKAKKLVLYSQNAALDLVCTSKPGVDHGDLSYRKLTLSRTLDGAVIGTAYTQAEVIAHDDKRDIRRIMLQAFLRKGVICLIGTSDLPLGTTPEPGWTSTYAIIGGTGRYAGAVGTMTAVFLADGTSFRNTMTHWQ